MVQHVTNDYNHNHRSCNVEVLGQFISEEKKKTLPLLLYYHIFFYFNYFSIVFKYSKIVRLSIQTPKA